MPPTTRSISAAKVPGAGHDLQQNHSTTIMDTAGPSKWSKPKRTENDIPPTYTIDLSLPPEKRYVQVALDFQSQLRNLTTLFDEVASSLPIPLSLPSIKKLARFFLRRVYSTEQTEELRGISQTVGVDMYLLVAFNVLLDLFMGCTSGGVKVSADEGTAKRMCHFRTLDWEMAKLRAVVVQWEFVDRPKGKVLARGVGYVGFVGILTGVRLVLSPSFFARLLSVLVHPSQTSVYSRSFMYIIVHI
jgi:hypothetical protein